jgi:GDPmannose 4,6-dehydratase
MLQQEKPDDFVAATGETHTIREFLDLAFDHVGLDWKKFVSTDKQLFRPAEIFELKGDYSKARKILNWKPEVSFTELVHMMVDADLERHQAHLSAKV